MTTSNDKWLALAAALTLGFALAGCNGDDETAEVIEPDPFPDGSGQGAFYDAPDYPDTPTGWSVGSIVPNFKFLALPNFADDSLNDAGERNGDIMYVISMADFYNPTGTEVYPEGSPFGAGRPKPKAIMLDMSAAWCGPCKDEASTVLPGKFAQYHDQGGQFLTVLTEDPYGDPAVVKTMFNWANAWAFSGWDQEYAYVLGIDPTAKVSPLFEPAYPSNGIIRTRDMKLIHAFSGVTPGSFWTIFEQVLNDTYQD